MSKVFIKKASKEEVKKFGKKEWRKFDIEHYGRSFKWVEKEFLFKAIDSGKIAGYVKFKYVCGVVYLSTLIIASEKRGKGIGKKLMERVERTAKNLKAHKIFLFTGEKWDVGQFYEKLGYKKTGDLPKHFHKVNFVIYSKIL